MKNVLLVFLSLFGVSTFAQAADLDCVITERDHSLKKEIKSVVSAPIEKKIIPTTDQKGATVTMGFISYESELFKGTSLSLQYSDLRLLAQVSEKTYGPDGRLQDYRGINSSIDLGKTIGSHDGQFSYSLSRNKVIFFKCAIRN